MKKFAIVLASALLCIGCIGFTGCSSSSQDQENQSQEESTDVDGGNAAANPMHESDKAGVLEATGIELNPPADAQGDAEYYYIDATDEDGSPIAEMRYTGADGVEYTYRAESTGELKAFDNSGMEYEWDDPATVTLDVNSCEATAQTCDEAAVIYWLDVVPGIDYSLSAASAVSVEDIIAQANNVFQSAQGEA